MSPMFILYTWIVLSFILLFSHRDLSLPLIVLTEVFVSVGIFSLAFQGSFSVLMLFFAVIVASSSLVLSLFMAVSRFNSSAQMLLGSGSS